MNWHIDSDGELHLELAEKEKAEPADKQLVATAKRAATSIAKKLGGKTSVEIHGHETTSGRGFRPGHVSVTVSKVDPKA
jgi:hypothetical protein